MAIFFKKNSVMDFLSTINNMIKTALNAENKEEKQEEKKFSGKSLFQSVKDYNHQMEEEKKSKKKKEESKKTEEKTGETGEKKETEEFELEVKEEIEEEIEEEKVGKELLVDENNNESKDDNVINLEDKLNIKSNESERIKNILELLDVAMEATKELKRETVENGEGYGSKEHVVGA